MMSHSDEVWILVKTLETQLFLNFTIVIIAYNIEGKI